MILMLEDTRSMSCEELQTFLEASTALTFNGHSRQETYAWIEQTLRRYDYLSRPRGQKGLLRRYLLKISGFSPAQLTRLIAQYRRTRHVQVRPYKRHHFPTRFTRHDRLLLAEVDEAHGRLSAPATIAILKREVRLFGHHEFANLSRISPAHLYRLRHGATYRAATGYFAKTHPAASRYGERRRPEPHGKPGYLRVDTVHQGDRDGKKGVYHVNVIDAVTQWELLGAVDQICEATLAPVLEDLLAQSPVVVRGFHSDNGSEFVNRVVAELLNKLLIEFTKSRPRRTNDQALVETKNGSVVRKQMGYEYIQAEQAQKIHRFYRETLNVYLNFHRPCGFAREVVDGKGKVRKCYDTYLTPFEKLKELPRWERSLRPGVTAADLEHLAGEHSDIEFAKIVQKKKLELFRSFSRSATFSS
jgi:transposase InsO family protein